VSHRISPRLATAGIFFVNGAVIGSWVAHIPFVRDELAISKTVVGLCLLALALGAVVAMPIAGQLLDRRSSAGLTRLAAYVEPLLLTIPLLAPSPATLALALLALGAVNGLLDVSMNAHGAALERELGRPIMSSLHAGYSLGGLAGAGLAAVGAVAGLDPRLQLCVVAVLLLGVALLCGPRLGDATTVTETAEASGHRLTLPSRPVVVLGLLAGAVMVAEGAVLDWSTLFLRDDRGAGASLAVAGFAAFSAGMATGRLTGDRLNRALGPVRLFAGGTGAAAAALTVALLVSAPLGAVVALGVVGLGVANAVPIAFSASGRVPGVPPGPAMAAVTTTGYLGLLAGPPVLGILADATSLTAALGLTAILVGLACLAAPRALRPGPRSRTRGTPSPARSCP